MSKVLKQGQTFTGSARVRVYQPEPGMPGQAGTGESTDGTENQEADSAGAGGQDTAGMPSYQKKSVKFWNTPGNRQNSRLPGYWRRHMPRGIT